jgi:uncharacterized membrane protein YhaH (DUF805 family)
MINYWLNGWKNFATFSGRARRSEYWYFLLMNLIVQYGAGFLIGQIDAAIGVMLTLAYSLVSLIPSIAVTVRRMHDTDNSGWFCLIPLYNLILVCTNGTQGTNRYGADPKGGEAGLDNPDILDA